MTGLISSSIAKSSALIFRIRQRYSPLERGRSAGRRVVLFFAAHRFQSPFEVLDQVFGDQANLFRAADECYFSKVDDR
jgi:hypothetical protein